MTLLAGSHQAMPFLYRRLRMCTKDSAKSKFQLVTGVRARRRLVGRGWEGASDRSWLMERYCWCRHKLNSRDGPHVSGWLTIMRRVKPPAPLSMARTTSQHRLERKSFNVSFVWKISTPILRNGTKKARAKQIRTILAWLQGCSCKCWLLRDGNG